MLGLISLTISLTLIVLGFIANRMRKNRMQKALGREIKSNDLTSINSWIQVAENEERTRS